MIKVVNIKQNNPNTDYAIYVLDSEIHDAKLTDIDVLVVVHGYGSHGRGGLIKLEALRHLKTLRNQGAIIDFVQGEHWSQTNEVVKTLCEKYPSLILHENLQSLNSGVTVVWVKK